MKQLETARYTACFSLCILIYYVLLLLLYVTLQSLAAGFKKFEKCMYSVALCNFFRASLLPIGRVV